MIKNYGGYECFPAHSLHFMWVVRSNFGRGPTELWVTDNFGNLVPTGVNSSRKHEPATTPLSHSLFNYPV